MKVNLNDMNPPAWFDIEGDVDKARVLLRICAGDDIDEINRLTSKRQPPEYKRGVRYAVPDEVDEKLRQEMVWDFIIVDWEGIMDDKGTPLPCTKENKVLFMTRSVAFATFISKCIEKLNADTLAYQEESPKNS